MVKFGITGLLQVAFIFLKLTNVIKWKWVWVLSPSWIVLVFIANVACIVWVMDKYLSMDE